MADGHKRFEELTNQFFSSLPEDAFVKVKCIICKEPKDPFFLFDKGAARIVRCGGCGLAYNERQPKSEILARFYAESKSIKIWGEHKADLNEVDRQNTKYSALGALIEKYKTLFKSGKIIDIGAGDGAFTKKLRQWFLTSSVTAIDPSSNGDNFTLKEAIESFDHQVESETYESAFMLGVLEHLPDPIGSLKKVYRWLRPHGLLCVIVPNMDSMAVQVLGKEAYTFCPQHLWYFNHNTLKFIANRASLFPLDKITTESETIPVLKKSFGLSPYDPFPDNFSYALRVAQLNDAEDLLSKGQGYKIVAILKKDKDIG